MDAEPIPDLVARVFPLPSAAGFSPFSSVPARALELARANPVRVIEDTVRPASLRRQVWRAAGAPALRRAGASREALSLRGARLRDGAGSR